MDRIFTMFNNTLRKLKKSMNTGNPDQLEDALNCAWKSGMKIKYVDCLNKMLLLPWHYCHEDIVNALQELKSPSSVDVLFETATIKYKYLDFDDEFSLSRKCTWALADIATLDAKSRLIALSNNKNPYISKYAIKRIGNWENELQRKNTKQTKQSIPLFSVRLWKNRTS
ncbi:MAG: hypothetical protein MJK11_10565 [Pseudomonadales bacterium]|nr:hypothetical protein [Pseudomonadales bacterium]